MDEKTYYIYFITNKYFNVLHTGVTNDLIRRVYEHKNKLQKGFSKKYNLEILVYYEMYADINEAIAREKQIKAWSRSKKDELVNQFNATWKDLYFELC